MFRCSLHVSVVVFNLRHSELKLTHANIQTALPHFKNVIFRHHYVMQKNSRYIETEQRYFCRVFHFNYQNLMLIRPPNDQATAYGTYRKHPTEH